MTYQDFKSIVASIPEAKDLEMFIAERGWQDWMNEYGEDTDRIVNILTAIYSLKDDVIHGLLNLTGLSQAQFSRDYGIPIRSIENWCGGQNSPTPYAASMMAYCVMSDYCLIMGNDDDE